MSQVCWERSLVGVAIARYLDLSNVYCVHSDASPEECLGSGTSRRCDEDTQVLRYSRNALVSTDAPETRTNSIAQVSRRGGWHCDEWRSKRTRGTPRAGRVVVVVVVVVVDDGKKDLLRVPQLQ